MDDMTRPGRGFPLDYIYFPPNLSQSAETKSCIRAGTLEAEQDDTASPSSCSGQSPLLSDQSAILDPVKSWKRGDLGAGGGGGGGRYGDIGLRG